MATFYMPKESFYVMAEAVGTVSVRSVDDLETFQDCHPWYVVVWMLGFLIVLY